MKTEDITLFSWKQVSIIWTILGTLALVVSIYLSSLLLSALALGGYFAAYLALEADEVEGKSEEEQHTRKVVFEYFQSLSTWLHEYLTEHGITEGKSFCIEIPISEIPIAPAVMNKHSKVQHLTHFMDTLIEITPLPYLTYEVDQQNLVIIITSTAEESLGSNP